MMALADIPAKTIATGGAPTAHHTTLPLNRAAVGANERVKHPVRVDHKQLLVRRPLTLSSLARTAP
jgi:hypothetical protein